MAKNCPLVEDHASDGFTRVHQVEGVIYPLKRHRVSNEIVDLDFLFHIPIDDLRNVSAPSRAAECGTLPYPARHELERAGGNLGTRGATPMITDSPQPR